MWVSEFGSCTSWTVPDLLVGGGTGRERQSKASVYNLRLGQVLERSPRGLLACGQLNSPCEHEGGTWGNRTWNRGSHSKFALWAWLARGVTGARSQRDISGTSWNKVSQCSIPRIMKGRKILHCCHCSGPSASHAFWFAGT